jgi:hypothetical protein
MSQTGVSHGRTIKTILFTHTSANDVVRAVRELKTPGGLGEAFSTLPEPLARVASDRIAQALEGLMDRPLIHVLLLGWKRHRRIQEAASRTLEHPGTEEDVELARHTIHARYEPHLEIYFDESLITDLGLELTVGADVLALIATVSAGRLIGIGSGRAELHAALGCEGAEVATADAVIDLTLEFELGDGIPLAP